MGCYSRGSSPPRDRTPISYIFCIRRQVLYHSCHLGSLNKRYLVLNNILILSGPEIKKFISHCSRETTPFSKNFLISRKLILENSSLRKMQMKKWSLRNKAPYPEGPSPRRPALSSLESGIFPPVLYQGLPRWLGCKESACQCRKHSRLRFDPWVGKITWQRKWQPILA